MPLQWLDHVNVRTAHLAELEAFYRDVLGLAAGARPAFSFNGRWLYLDGRAVVHLVERERQPRVDETRVEHFAFRASGYSDFVARLQARGVEFVQSDVPGYALRQVNVHDPDGNRIEVTFDSGAEAIDPL